MISMRKVKCIFFAVVIINAIMFSFIQLDSDTIFYGPALPKTSTPVSARSRGFSDVSSSALDIFNSTTYLPPTLSIIQRFYSDSIKSDSFSMILVPQNYLSMNCDELQQQHRSEYKTVIGRINFSEGPRFSVPGFFYDPYPLCGRYLLSKLTVDRHPFLYILRAKKSMINHKELEVQTGIWYEDIVIEQCGECLKNSEQSCDLDVLFVARLFNENFVFHAEVIPQAAVGDTQRGKRHVAAAIRFRILDPGEYTLEVKMVHVNGSSDDISLSKTLGLVGTRATVNGKKAFLYGSVCDIQRNIYGSPMRLRAVLSPDKVSTNSTVTFCNISRNYHTNEGGKWVRFIDGAKPDTPEGVVHSLAANCTSGDRYCDGNPISLTDACGHNNHLVWVPSTCKLRIFPMGSGGPSTQCLQTQPFRQRPAYILFVGDSVMREYKSNCDEMNFSRGRSFLRCLFANIAPEGKYFSSGYARAFVRSMLDNVQDNRPLGVFVTNLGIQHMIGVASTRQFIELVDIFVDEWRRRNFTVLRGPYTTMPIFGSPMPLERENSTDEKWRQYMQDQNFRSMTIMNQTDKPQTLKKYTPYMEWAVWLSPPTVHYARHGMSHQRELKWDRLAYKRLQKIGFIRIDTMTPTLSRQEGTWDGLHQLSQFHKVQSPWRNRKAKPHKYNGGVSFMLFLILLNVICFS